MFTFPSTVKVYICKEPVSMHKSYDGLCGSTSSLIGADPLSGHLFVFYNRRRTMVKILMWDSTGMCLYCKRLESGNFRFETRAERTYNVAELMLILEGIDFSRAQRRRQLQARSYI